VQHISKFAPQTLITMAKAAPKAPVKAAPKKAAPKKTAVSPTELIIKACETSLAKLNDLNIDHQLQSEINWCLSSFQNDGNPIGLYQMAERSLIVFKAELAKKTKGVTSKLITDIEKALKADA
jgi:hypothetical protein